MSGLGGREGWSVGREGEGKGEKEEVRIGWKEGQLGNRRRERRRKRI